MSEFDLDPDRIEAALAGGTLGRRVIIYRETASTNDLVERMADAGAEEGMVVVADRQTRGRGQFGRRWDSPAGVGLWFSVLVRPKWPGQEIGQLTPLVAVAVSRAIAGVTVLSPRIKPPNDLMIGGRKVAGILTEARTGGQTRAVIGIGVNVNQARSEFPIELQESATSLALETGRELGREALLIAILSSLDRGYDPARPPGEEIANAYADLSRRPDCASFPP